jgi:hypothetical protein
MLPYVRKVDGLLRLDNHDSEAIIHVELECRFASWCLGKFIRCEGENTLKREEIALVFSPMQT